MNIAGGDPGLSIALDDAGNSYVAGYYSGTMAFGNTTLTSNGSADAYVSKIGPDGVFQWTKSFGGPNYDMGRAVAVDGGGNVYLTGRIENLGGVVTFGSFALTGEGGTDIFTVKLDPSGNVLWAAQGGGHGATASSETYAISVDSVGRVFVGGRFSGVGDFGGAPIASVGEQDSIVAALDAATGATIWVRTRGGPGLDSSNGVALDAGNNLFVTWSDGLDPSLTSEGGGRGYAYLSKLDPNNGATVWDQSIAPTDLEGFVAGQIAVANNQDGASVYVATGRIFKFHDAGDSGELVSINDALNANGLATDDAGNLYGAAANGEWWKISSDGVLLARREIGRQLVDWGWNAPFDIAVDQNGNVITTGEFSGSNASFDIGTAYAGLASPSSQGMFVVKTTQDLGGITGSAFNDLNNNGAWDYTDWNGNGRWDLQEPGEPSLAGATVFIDANGNGAVDAGEPTATVQTLGEFQFPHVAAGDHSVRLLAPSGFTQSLPSAGLPRLEAVDAGRFNFDVGFGAYSPSQTKNYVSTDVPKKYPSRGFQEAYSNLAINDSYAVFGIDVSVTVTSNQVQLTLIAPDGTARSVQPGTVHLDDFNYKNVNGTWKLQIKKFDPWPSGSVTAWSMTVLGQAAAPAPGALAQLAVTELAQTTTAGETRTFQVTARGANGAVLTGYTGTVRFTSTDPQAILPADYTFTVADQGVRTFSADLRTAGFQTISVTDASASVTVQAGIQVNPAIAVRLAISGPSNVKANNSFSVTVTARDAYGNVATGYRGTVRAASSDPNAVLPANYTFTPADNGVFTFTGLVLKKKGNQTIAFNDISTGTIAGSLSIGVK